MKKIIIPSLIVIFIDQIIKVIIASTLNLYESNKLIGNFLYLTYVKNTGAAFSILNNNTVFLIILSIVALIFIYFFLIKNKRLSKFENIFYSLLIGGIIGNLIDRIFRGYVIDYIGVNIINYQFPIFNFADICIVLSVILMIFYEFIGDKNEAQSK